jgi:hypothetical protein
VRRADDTPASGAPEGAPHSGGGVEYRYCIGLNQVGMDGIFKA